MRHLGRAAVVLALLSATAAGQTLNDTRLRYTTWVSGLSAPTSFTWIGPGEMLVIQKNNGKVRWVKDGVILGDALDLPVDTSSERGGLGIAADPDFANNGYVYLYYSRSMTSSDNGGWLENRVERYTWNGATLGNVFGPLIAFPMDAQQSNGPNHDGGILRIGPDGKLYGQTGDLNRGRFGGGMERVEQNTATTGSADVGGIFRINTDGTIPSDNPFTGEADSSLHLWWSYGLRNGYGMTWDRVNGELWNTENGPNLYDEVDRVPKGMNSGWLKLMGPDSRDAKYSENGNQAFDESDLVFLQNSAYLDPVFSFKTPVGITAIEFLASKLFPTDMVDDCVFGDNNNGNLYFCELQSGRTSFKLPTGLTDKVADTTAERSKIVWGTGWGVVTDAQIGHDGYLYVVNHTSNRIYKVRPVTDGVDPEWRVDPGMQQAGTQDNAEESDDKTWNVTEATFSLPPRPFVIGATFKLNSAAPTSIVVQVETRYGRMAVPQAIHALNRNTGKWDLLDATTVGKTDVALSLPLATPADYIDPTTLKVELRLIAKPPMVKPIPRKLTLLVDLFRLDVTYP